MTVLLLLLLLYTYRIRKAAVDVMRRSASRIHCRSITFSSADGAKWECWPSSKWIIHLLTVRQTDKCSGRPYIGMDRWTSLEWCASRIAVWVSVSTATYLYTYSSRSRHASRFHAFAFGEPFAMKWLQVSAVCSWHMYVVYFDSNVIISILLKNRFWTIFSFFN